VSSGPIPYNGVVYVGRNSGEFHALNDSDGQKVNASWPFTGASGNGDTGPWIDESRQRVLFGTTGGGLSSFSAE
jgi:outer membrane protein assembly factor BamB